MPETERPCFVSETALGSIFSLTGSNIGSKDDLPYEVLESFIKLVSLTTAKRYEYINV